MVQVHSKPCKTIIRWNSQNPCGVTLVWSRKPACWLKIYSSDSSCHEARPDMCNSSAMNSLSDNASRKDSHAQHALLKNLSDVVFLHGFDAAVRLLHDHRHWKTQDRSKMLTGQDKNFWDGRRTARSFYERGVECWKDEEKGTEKYQNGKR